MKETETNRTNKNNKQRDRKKSYINTYIFVNQKKMSQPIINICTIWREASSNNTRMGLNQIRGREPEKNTLYLWDGSDKKVVRKKKKIATKLCFVWQYWK